MLISLVGLPGVGKSALGRRLARSLGADFLDCDALLEARFGCPIRDLFETAGENVFRDAESELLRQLVSERQDAVVATGGGIVLRTENRVLLRERSICIYLRVAVEALARRLAHDSKRPLLQVPDRLARLHAMSDEREPLYRQVAASVVDTDGLSFPALLEKLSVAVAGERRAASA